MATHSKFPLSLWERVSRAEGSGTGEGMPPNKHRNHTIAPKTKQGPKAPVHHFYGAEGGI